MKQGSEQLPFQPTTKEHLRLKMKYVENLNFCLKNVTSVVQGAWKGTTLIFGIASWNLWILGGITTVVGEIGESDVSVSMTTRSH